MSKIPFQKEERMSATNAVSRRSRSMESKQRRISEAAAELFDAEGFSAVT